jgi:hypothetical protein
VLVVLNLKTGLCSPQYHVVFDDNFTTVCHATATTPPPNWSDLFNHNCINVLDGESPKAIPDKLDSAWNDSTGDPAQPSSAVCNEFHFTYVEHSSSLILVSLLGVYAVFFIQSLSSLWIQVLVES